MPKLTKAEWSARYVNDLGDGSFLHISPGGEKDAEGKTTPRSLRHFPVKDADGAVDLPHLRNAIARIPQSTAPGLDADAKRALQEEARRMLEAAQKVAKQARADIAKAAGATIAKLAGSMHVRALKGLTAAEMALSELRWPLGLGPMDGPTEVRARIARLVKEPAEPGVDRTGLIEGLRRHLGLPALTDEATTLALAEQVVVAVEAIRGEPTPAVAS